MEKEKMVGLTKDTSFQAGIRKTFNCSVEDTWDFLFSDFGLTCWLNGVSTEQIQWNKLFKTGDGTECRVTTFKPYSHIRMTWKSKFGYNVSIVQVRVINLNNKATISFHHEKLLDYKQREEMKKHWKRALTEIGDKLFNNKKISDC